MFTLCYFLHSDFFCSSREKLQLFHVSTTIAQNYWLHVWLDPKPKGNPNPSYFWLTFESKFRTNVIFYSWCWLCANIVKETRSLSLLLLCYWEESYRTWLMLQEYVVMDEVKRLKLKLKNVVWSKNCKYRYLRIMLW